MATHEDANEGGQDVYDEVVAKGGDQEEADEMHNSVEVEKAVHEEAMAESGDQELEEADEAEIKVEEEAETIRNGQGEQEEI